MSLNDALNLMDQKEDPFSIKFVTFNKKKQSGGEIIEMPEAVKCGLAVNMMKNGLIGIRHPDNTNHPIPVHIRLITEVNGQKIFW